MGHMWLKKNISNFPSIQNTIKGIQNTNAKMEMNNKTTIYEHCTSRVSMEYTRRHKMELKLILFLQSMNQHEFPSSTMFSSTSPMSSTLNIHCFTRIWTKSNLWPFTYLVTWLLSHYDSLNPIYDYSNHHIHVKLI